jgi:general secretion pathway protein A
MVRLAYQAMLDKLKEGLNLVLIIDEAQNMPIETLGNLCILSNFETAKAKLIQIVLVGQPELQQKLNLFELRQLRQRIAYKALITPLSVTESYNYFYHRLSLSARGKDAVFSNSAIKRIIKHSKGVPRIINVLGENALVASYSLQKKPVSSRLVKQVIAEYEGGSSPGKVQFRVVELGMLILVPSALLVASYFYTDSYPSFMNELAAPQVRLKIPDAFQREQHKKTGKVASFKEEPVALVRSEIPLRVEDKQPIPSVVVETANNLPAEAALPQSISLQPVPAESAVSKQKPTAPAVEIKSLWPNTESKFSLLGEDYRTSQQSAPIIKIIKKGDTVYQLCLDTYGVYNAKIYLWIRGHNPHIENMDQIQIGGIIFFPQMESPILLHRQHRIKSLSSHIREEVALK